MRRAAISRLTGKIRPQSTTCRPSPHHWHCFQVRRCHLGSRRHGLRDKHGLLHLVPASCAMPQPTGYALPPCTTALNVCASVTLLSPLAVCSILQQHTLMSQHVTGTQCCELLASAEVGTLSPINLLYCTENTTLKASACVSVLQVAKTPSLP